MFIKVRLLNGFQKSLTYKVPAGWDTSNLVDKIICVPIKNKDLPAIVLQQFDKLEKWENFEIREAKYIESFPQDKNYNNFINSLCQYYQIDKFHFIKRIKGFLTQQSEELIPEVIANSELVSGDCYSEEQDLKITPEQNQDLDLDPESARISQKNNCENNITPAQLLKNKNLKDSVSLTQEQQEVVDFLQDKIIDGQYQPTLLHGVTGSGKTEIYKKLIITCIENNKSALLLLPEVTLAIQFEKIMRAQLPENISIHSFHSGTTIKNKKLTWDMLLKNKPILIIGVHIPVILPIANLGFIIVDEEHETGYQEKKHPKINSKDAAIMRAYENKIPILLGSATPSLSSLYNVKTKNWKFLQLKNRFKGNFPQIKTVFLGDKKTSRNFWISHLLEDSIREKLAKKEQVIIFLNRRGYSFFVQCKACSFIFSCPNCSVSLTLHNSSKLSKSSNSRVNNAQNISETLNCHYCDYSIAHPECCPECSKKEFLKKGIGTQQVVTILEKIFPQARIARADMDTTTKKKLWQETMRDFESGEINILVGTQTISKGFHFPRVTLVGILWADLNLHFPIFNATETTLQQLIQVAGRAGRNHEKSEVIVQAIGMHKIFDYLNEIDYLNFYINEIENRKMVGYPPCKRLIEIELKNTSETNIDSEAEMLAGLLINIFRKNILTADVLGPAQPPVSKIKNTYIRKIYIKCDNILLVGQLFRAINFDQYSSQVYFTPNPLN